MEQDDDHSSFLPDWTLPELPKPTTSLSTTRLEDIFDTNIHPLIGLQDDVGALSGSHDDSSGPLISSIEESLEMKPPGGGLESDESGVIDSTDKNTASTTKSEHPASLVKSNSTPVTSSLHTPTERGEEMINKNQQQEEERRDNDTSSSPAATGNSDGSIVVVQEETVDSTTVKEEGEEEEEEGVREDAIIRRSARLRSGKQEEEIKTPKSESGDVNEVKVEKEEEIPIAATATVVKEEEEIVVEVERSEGEEEEDSSEYAESDDPDKVWCICQQPHDDRFMICCDRCGEWYHGDCVGITVAEGKKMEKCGQDYICVRCNDYDANSKAERAKNRSLRQSRRERIRAKQIAELLEKRQGGSGSSPGHGGPVKKEKTTRTCAGPGCDKPTTVTSIYCSEACIKKHVEFSLKKLKVRGLSRGSSAPGDFGKGSGGVTVLDTLTKKVLTGLSAPSEKALIPWIKSHPSYKVFVPPLKGATPNKKAMPIKKSHDEGENEVTTPTSSGPKTGETNTRKLAQKAFLHALQTRTQLLPEEERASEDTLSKLALDIETKLYNLYNQEVNQKYRIKCRSLLFNLKDTKNQGLFKKLLCQELSTRKLVRMTPEQLASDELAQWREKTIKKELEMITEVAKEALEMSSVVRKMTYKGEVEIERNTDITLESPVKGQSEVTSTTNEVKYTPSSLPPSTTVIVKEEPSSIINSLLNDTTDKHGTHVFDQNCSICTSRDLATTTNIKEEEEEEEEKEEDNHHSTFNRLTSSSSNFSPDSRGEDQMEHVVTSPDSVSVPYSIPSTAGGSSSTVPLWKGNLTMHAQPTFSAVAYHVSGRLQELNEFFPETLQIIGRIGHKQVWDYLDKLKCSTSKEVVVLRFERIENEESTYLEMMDFFIRKQRYGVIQNTAHVKDMYIIPLLSNESVPGQLLPLDGPGLPLNRQDTFLCVITRPKVVPVSNDTPRKRRYSGRVSFTSSSPDVFSQGPPEKKPHPSTFSSQPQIEVGFGGATPPATPPPIKVSFYGDSRESFDKKPPIVAPSLKPSDNNDESSTFPKVPGISHSGIKSILSTLSDSKLQELASAMSTIQPSSSSTGSSSSQEQTNNNSQTTDTPLTDNTTATTGEPRLSLDERLSALQASNDKPIVSDPRLATPTNPTPSSTTVESGPSITDKPQSDTTTTEHGEGRPTSGRYTYTRYDEEGAAQHYRDVYHGNHTGYYDYRDSHDDRGYRDDYNHHYDPRRSRPYWRDREHPSSYNRNIDDRYGGEERRYDHSERGNRFSYHHHRTSRWTN